MNRKARRYILMLCDPMIAINLRRISIRCDNTWWPSRAAAGIAASFGGRTR